jgi:alpha-mannosidase
MLNTIQIKRMVGKLERFVEMLDPMLFEPVCTLPAVSFQTLEQFHSIPENVEWTPVEKGDIWGGESMYCWFKTEYVVPAELAGKELFLRPDAGGYEAMLFINGKPMGTYATKIVVTGHGNPLLQPDCRFSQSRGKD